MKLIHLKTPQMNILNIDIVTDEKSKDHDSIVMIKMNGCSHNQTSHKGCWTMKKNSQN
jgi:hypothetical protein